MLDVLFQIRFRAEEEHADAGAPRGQCACHIGQLIQINELHDGPWRVVRRQGSGHAKLGFTVLAETDASACFQCFPSHTARAQDAWRVLGHVHNRALDPNAACSAIQDRHRLPEFLADMLRRRWAQFAKSVRGRRRQGTAKSTDQLASQGVLRYAHGNRPLFRGDQRRNRRCRRQHQGQGAWPERLGQTSSQCWRRRGPPRQPIRIGEVDDEGVAARSLLEFEDLGDSVVLGGIGAQAVDGLGGERDHTALSKHANGFGDLFRGRLRHAGNLALSPHNTAESVRFLLRGGFRVHDPDKSEKIRATLEDQVTEEDNDKQSRELDSNEQVVALLKEIRELIVVGGEKQSRYIWMLFPIIAILLIQAILMATNL